METKTLLYVIGAAIAVLAVVAVLLFPLFAPAASTQMNEDLEAATSDATLLATGVWEGADSLHRASGTVKLWQGDGGPFLSFEDYEATRGPDVYLYASTDADGQYRAENVVQILVPGGEDDGHATLRGDFVVPIPDELAGDVDDWKSLIIWCKRFSVQFGSAELAAG